MMKRSQLWSIGAMLLSVLLQLSCSKEPTMKKNDAIMYKRVTDDGYKSEYAYNVNIVYLIPSDRDTAVNYRKRLSELFLWAQDWTKKEMTRRGYPDRTFGLLVNDQKEVKIHVLRSAYKHSDFPYEAAKGGAQRAEDEVNKYLNEQGLRASDHTIILYPGGLAENGIDPAAGTPFYGRGKICHALDYEKMSLENLSSNNAALRKVTRKWYGGMIHELFHGLNLPHNSETAQELAEKKQAIMRDHYNFGPNDGIGNETILTAASAAIFSVSQIFSKTEGSFYQEVKLSPTLEELSYNKASKSISIKGKFETEGKVQRIIAYVDPHTKGDIGEKKNAVLAGNTEYNAVSFTTAPTSNGSFNFSIPTESLQNFDTEITHYIYVTFVLDNGYLKRGLFLVPFKYNTNKEPLFIVDVNQGEKELAEKSDWKIHSFSSEHTGWNNYAKYVIDNNYETNWYPSSGALPHEITIDLGKKTVFNGVAWSNALSGYLRSAKDVEILVADEPTASFSSLGTYEIASTRLRQYVSPDKGDIQARYIKFIIKSTHEENSYLYVSEIDLFRKKQ